MHILAVLLFGVVFPACARSENRFRRPPGPGPAGDFRDNPVYTLGDNIDLQWEMDLKNIDLILWQQQPTGNLKGPYAKLASNSTVKSLVWTVGYAGFPSTMNPDLSQVYFLQLFKTGQSGSSATSHYFNITEPDSTSTSTSSATATTTALALASAQSPTAPADEDQLSSTAVAGIAVGATLGALLFLALLAGLVRRYVKRRRDMAVHTEGDILVYAERQLRAKDEAAAWKLELPAHSRERFEVEACEPRHEMPAEPVGVGMERG
ncbi:hypothetical protein CPAR01_11870 [Colletotrichum paranaense]|uniref:Uncharacterized protein n=1 Tax=Colletotrichum paranaense TaxID=1914294 RepID=A0ABQ9S8D4_9PEZI|nr:uncharacterized protein CPAR01_11870 [Colletotrichum paranaense]KAK1529558.1 hypothetical protein CPAR01_11870 [Colletotrichum paranaense]